VGIASSGGEASCGERLRPINRVVHGEGESVGGEEKRA
jgi:hypothetical protein